MLLIFSHVLLLLQRPMVRLNIGEELFVEWRGKWMKAVVTQIDCSLVRVSGVPHCAISHSLLHNRYCFQRQGCMNGYTGDRPDWSQSS